MIHNSVDQYSSLYYTLLVLFGAGWVGMGGVLLVVCGPACGRLWCWAWLEG